MSPPRPRFTVRRLMAAVAVVAIPLGAGLRLKPLRDRYRAAALGYTRQESMLRWAASIRGLNAGDAAWNGRLAGHYGALRRKSDFASRFPWLPVSADPPDPD